MTLSALGISIETRGVDEAARRLDAVSAAANRVDASVDKIAPAASHASDGLRKMGAEARDAESAISSLTTRALTGFNAIAYRAAQQAEYVAEQMEKITFRDLREKDIEAYGDGLDRLRAKYNPLFAASKQYESSLDDLNDAERVGAINSREHGEALDKLNKRYQDATKAANEYERAAKFAAAEEAASAARHAQSSVNTTLGVRTDFDGERRAADIRAYGAALDEVRAKYNPIFAASKRYEQALDDANHALKSGAINAREYETYLASLANEYLELTNAANGAARAIRYAAAEQAASAAKHAQTAINTQLGVKTDFGSEVREEDIAAYGAELERLRGKFNPIYAASKQYEAELNELNRAVKLMVISEKEHGAALIQLNERYQLAATGAQVFGANSRMAQQQVRNLAFQFQDIGTMMAMGQNPFMLLAQQLPQVTMYGGRLDGVMTALRSTFAGLVSPLGLLTTGFVLAGSAAISYLSSATDTTSKVDEALKQHEENIKRLKDRWGEAAKGIEAYRLESEKIDRLNAAVTRDQLRSGVTGGIEGVLNRTTIASLSALNAQGFRSIGTEIVPEYEKMADAILKLNASAKSSDDLIRFRNELAELWSQNPNDTELRGYILEIMKLTDEAAKAALALGAAGDAADVANRRFKAFAQEGFRSANDNLRQYVPDQRTDLQKIEAEYQRAAGAATRLGQSARAVDGLMAEANRNRAAAIDELTRKENVRRGLYELDYKAITARSAVEKANIAAERERLNLSGQALSEQDKARRIEEARTLSLRQSHREATEAQRQRIEAERDAITQMELDITLIGKSAGEVARLTTEYDLLQAAKKAAFEEGRSVGDEEIERIRRHAAEVGRLAESYAALRALDDIRFDISIMGLSEGDQKIMSALRSRGIEADGSWGQMVGGAMRYRDVQQELQDEMKEMQKIGKDALGSILDLLYETGDIGDKLIGIFANIGKQFAKMGLDRLWKSISGEGGSVFGGGSLNFSVPEMAGGGRGFSPIQTAQIGREIGAAAAPSMAGSIDSGMETFMAAIRKVESGSHAGNYGALGPILTKGSYKGDRAYGAYQVMGGNIEQWTREVLGTSMSIKDFLGNQAAQDKVAFAKLSQSIEKFGSFSDAASVWFSGQPVSKAGNRSDGYNSVQQYVGKVNSAMDSYPGGTRAAVRDGTVDAAKRLQTFGGRSEDFDTGTGAPGVLKGGRLEGMLGVGGAALGAFAGGYQSGSPVMGALSGAMSGFGAAGAIGAAFPALAGVAGPIGLIGGAVIGLIGGILGRAKQKREELKKAQQELESQMGAITQLIRSATGNFMGQFEKSILETSDEIAKAIQMAQKAKNQKLVDELQAAQEEFFRETTEKWVRGFEGMIESMQAGLGFDGAFSSGMDAVEKMRESLVGFVNDAKMFAESNGDLAAYMKEQRKLFASNDNQPKIYEYRPSWDGYDSDSNYQVHNNDLVDGYRALGDQMVKLGVQAYTEVGGALYKSLDELKTAAYAAGLAIDEQGVATRQMAEISIELADSVERARNAAEATALAMLSGAREFTEMEQAVQKLQGAAAGLPILLSDLGRSAEEAAALIEKHMLVAMKKMRLAFETDVVRSIMSLSDMGYMNDFADALANMQTRIRDAHAAGGDMRLVFTELSLRLRQIAGDAELSAENLTRLAEVFPEFAGQLMELASMGGGASLSSAKAALDQAKADLRAAYEAEKSSIEQLINRHHSLIKSLRQFIDDLRLDANLSPLDPFQRLQEAQKQFQETAALALTGDEEALGKIESVSRSYLEEARAYYATSEAYFSIFNDVEAILKQSLSSAEKQLSEAEQQLAALDAQIGQLIDIADNTKSIADAIADLAVAEAAYAAAVDARFAEMAALMAMQREQQKQQAAYYVSPEVEKLYKDVVGRFPEQQGADYWQRIIGTGLDMNEVYRRFIHDVIGLGATPNAAAVNRYGVGSVGSSGSAMFWNGGYTGDGGIYEPAGTVHGQEFVADATATRKYRPQLEAMNAGTYQGGNMSEVVSEVRALRQQVASMDASNVSATVAAARGQIAASDGTTNAVNRQSQGNWLTSIARKTA